MATFYAALKAKGLVILSGTGKTTLAQEFEGQTWVLHPLIDITHTLSPEERQEFAEDYAAADAEDSLTDEQAMAYYREKLKRLNKLPT